MAEGSDAGAKRAAGGTHTGVNAAKWARRSGSGATARRQWKVRHARTACARTCKECGGEYLRAPSPKEPMQGVRGGEPLPAPAPKDPMQGVRGGEPLPAPAPKEHMQGVRGGEPLPAPMQGVRGGEQSASTSAEEANASLYNY